MEFIYIELCVRSKSIYDAQRRRCYNGNDVLSNCDGYGRDHEVILVKRRKRKKEQTRRNGDERREIEIWKGREGLSRATAACEKLRKKYSWHTKLQNMWHESDLIVCNGFGSACLFQISVGTFFFVREPFEINPAFAR